MKISIAGWIQSTSPIIEGNCKYKQVICSPFLHLKIRTELESSGIASCYSEGLFCIDSSALGTARVLQRKEIRLIKISSVKRKSSLVSLKVNREKNYINAFLFPKAGLLSAEDD